MREHQDSRFLPGDFGEFVVIDRPGTMVTMESPGTVRAICLPSSRNNALVGQVIRYLMTGITCLPQTSIITSEFLRGFFPVQTLERRPKGFRVKTGAQDFLATIAVENVEV